MQPYKNIYLWKRADEFVKACYLVTNDFPSEEKFGVTSQLRRAALSVVLNIVEGNAWSTTKELIRFLIISRGSLAECSYLLELSKHLGYLSENKYNEIESIRNNVSYLLQQSLSGLQEKQNTTS